MYADDNHSTEYVRLQSPGFHYHPTHSSEVAMSSSDSDYEPTSVLQYVAPPPAQPTEHGVPRSATWSGDYSACPETALDVRFSVAREPMTDTDNQIM